MRYLLILLAAAVAWGQTTETTITDTVRVPVSSGLFSGQVDVRPSASMTCGTNAYVPVPVQVRVNNGALSLTLVPNASCSPLDGEGNPASYYSARFTDRTRNVSWLETWVVPVSVSAVNLSTIRSSVPTAASISISLSQLLAGSATTGQAIVFNGTSWVAGTPTATPTAHASSHAAAGSDPVTLAQAQITNLTTDLSGKEPTISAGTTGQYWRGDKSWQTLNSAAVGLGNVENTALSTWAGSGNITTVGTLVSGGLPWSLVTGAPSTYDPTAHAASHAAAGADPLTLSSSQVGLGNVENTALSTWAGSSNITTLGIVASGEVPWALLTGVPSEYTPSSHSHATSDITSGELPLARGGTGADFSASTGFVRVAGGSASASALANSDLPDAFDISGKTSTKPIKSGTAAPGTCATGEVFFDTDATAGENLLLCTSANTWTAIISGGGSLTTYGTNSFTASFTSQTSVVLSHNFNSTKQVLACYDGSNQWIEPLAISVGLPSSTVTFSSAQSGSCTVIGGTALYDESFSAQTSVNLDHNFNTYNVVVRCYDGSENLVEPNTIAAAGLDDTTVTFSNAQTGHCTVAASLADGGGGGSGTVTSVGVSGVSGILSVSGSPVTTSGTMALSLDTQSANTVLAGPTSGGAATPAFRSLVNADLPAALDLTGNTSTAPIKAGTTAPASCSVGQMFFDTDATAGSNLYLCTATDTWTQVSGTDGGTESGLTGFSASATLSSWGTIAANSCSDKNITLTGAVTGDTVVPGWPSTLEDGIVGNMIAASDLVIVRLCNVTTSGKAVADQSFTARVVREIE